MSRLYGHLARYAHSCHVADRSDPATMANLREIIVPRLRRHLVDLVFGLRRDRRSRRPVPRPLRADLVLEAWECRAAIRAGQRLTGPTGQE